MFLGEDEGRRLMIDDEDRIAALQPLAADPWTMRAA
jgi:putative ubiquitin-RnfH superfamily antitoxin RatB of RatAB toxin-antitoxin module